MNKAKKIVLGVCGLVAVGTAIYIVVKNSNSAESKSKKNAEQLAEETEKKLSNDPNNYVKTISQAEARDICDRLFEAMNGMGTDTTTIKDVLFNRSTALQPGDFALIYQNWGWNHPDGKNITDHRVEYGTFGLPWWGNGTRLDICGWFERELEYNADAKGQESLYEKIRLCFKQAGCWTGN